MGVQNCGFHILREEMFEQNFSNFICHAYIKKTMWGKMCISHLVKVTVFIFLWLVELNRCLVPCSPAFKQTCLDGREYLGFCLWLLEKAIEFFRRNSLVWIYCLFLMYDAYSLSVKSDMIEISLERKTNRWWTKHWKKMKMKPRYILTHPLKLLSLSFF